MPPTVASDSRQNTDSFPGWSRTWHIWTIVMPRRSIDGSMVYGRVWRRHDGRSWIYKRLVDLNEMH